MKSRVRACADGGVEVLGPRWQLWHAILSCALFLALAVVSSTASGGWLPLVYLGAVVLWGVAAVVAARGRLWVDADGIRVRGAVRVRGHGWVDVRAVALDWEGFHRWAPKPLRLTTPDGERRLPTAALLNGLQQPAAQEDRERLEATLRRCAAAHDVRVSITPPAWTRWRQEGRDSIARRPRDPEQGAAR